MVKSCILDCYVKEFRTNLGKEGVSELLRGDFVKGLFSSQEEKKLKITLSSFCLVFDRIEINLDGISRLMSALQGRQG